MTAPKPRLLVFVIAYYADKTLKQVLERIPRSVFDDYDCEVLVVDDASTDRTFEIGREYREAHPEMRMTVLRNDYNQGYGGNQKVGYSFALAHGFDFVAMVHGDGQYAPEELPSLVAPLRDGEADAVFGSRMMSRFGALRGGMPLYKYVGNKILSTIQNRLLRTKLSEFHSGYRVYSVALLRRIPFRLNSNDFHFDTEIIIQVLNAGGRILEKPIPTYYGDEISRVNGMRYAKDVVLATIKNVLHRSQILYQRRFDTDAQDNTHYDLKLGYPSSHSYALAAVPEGASVMDLGSGPGEIADELHRKGCQVAVVDRFGPPRTSNGLQVVVQDLEDDLRFDLGPYRYLLLLDIIEHLRDPERFMERLRDKFDYTERTVIVTTPNVAFLVQRLMLLFGQFNYGKQGILDRTHTRLYTFRGMLRLLRDAGFRIEEVKGIPAPFPKALGDGVLGRTALAINLALIRVSKTLFSYQIYVKAKTTPNVDFVLRSAERSSAERERLPADPPSTALGSGSAPR
jgi:glycosyltransferase involved in cell wall biosynthesis